MMVVNVMTRQDPSSGFIIGNYIFVVRVSACEGMPNQWERI